MYGYLTPDRLLKNVKNYCFFSLNLFAIANNDVPNSNQELTGRTTKRMAKTADKPFREKHFKKGSRKEGDLDYGQIKDGKI